MGKDNIPFHTVIWPAMLLGYGGLNLPYNVPANEYMNLEDRKLSTSRNWAVWMLDYLDRYEPDPLRYVISAMMPETSDSDFSWSEYVRRNNDELVATYGNLVHRTLSMAGRNFNRTVPDPGILDEESNALLEQAREALNETGRNIADCRFRNGLQAAMRLAQSTNRYLDSKAPWQAVKTDKADAARTVWTGMSVINCLKTALCPFMPGSSEKLHIMLGLDGSRRIGGLGLGSESTETGQSTSTPETSVPQIR